MVQDMVANHIGTEHYWMKSVPDSNWIHFSGKPFTRCNFRIETIADPHASPDDRILMTDGWFDTHMADLNQQHPLLARYLIQNTLWWIAETGIDGIRMDTWPYNDKEFMSRWCEEVKAEFPRFSIVGEVWVEQPAFAAYFTKGTLNQDGYRPSLPSCTDFPLYFALTTGLNEKGSWETGHHRVYNALSQDFLYKDASANLIFADNHDLSQFISTQSGDFKRYQQGMAMLLTLRGVPQLYYGGDFALEGDGSQHSNVRLDFNGGWAGDKENFFEAKNLKGRADSAFHFLQSLLNWRKTSKAVAEGSFTQYLPEDNIYVYFRLLEGEAVMVAVNGNQETKKLKTDRFRELARYSASAKDVLANKSTDLSRKVIEIPAQGVLILELQR
jgi:glycosidase